MIIDLPEAGSIRESTACEKGDARACSDACVAYFNRGLGERDYEKVRLLAERACAGSQDQGCLVLGLIFEDGYGVVPDPAKAAELYTRACDADGTGACIRLGWLRQFCLDTGIDFMARLVPLVPPPRVHQVLAPRSRLRRETKRQARLVEARGVVDRQRRPARRQSEVGATPPCVMPPGPTP